MPYNLSYASGTGTLVVQDNTANTQTTLVLPGKDFVGYGSPVDQNQLSMLEHYASYSEAAMNQKAIRGQIWFNTTTQKLLVNTSASTDPGLKNWVEVQTGPGVIASTTTLGIIRVGSGLSITSTGTLSATGDGNGTVTSVSVNSANGFSGSVANSTSTPAITIATTVNGLLKGNGTAVSAASAGTDYQVPITLTTTGSSGAATFVNNVLNIPQYSGGGGGGGGITSVTATANSGITAVTVGGAVTLNTTYASTSTSGVVKIDGSSIVISSEGVISATGGGGGGVGFQSTVLRIRRWAATQPALPNYTSEYTWSNNSLSSIPADWYLIAPTVSPTPGWSLWEIAKSLYQPTSDITTIFNWNTGNITQISAPGTDGNQYSPVFLYQWAPAQPNNPTGTSTFTWATGANSNYTVTDGWSVTVPTNPGTALLRLWVATKSIEAAAGVATTTVDWTTGVTVYAMTQNGAEGPPGAKNAFASIYRWGIPPAPTIDAGTTSTFTWSSGTVTAETVPSGWYNSNNIPAPTPGYYLYEAKQQISAAYNATTTNFSWDGCAILIASYAGDNGTGSIQSRMAYARIPGLVSPLSAQIVVAGDNRPTQSESNTTWGLNYAWSATDPNPTTATESLYVSAGIYNGTTTVWDTPYLSALRVGSLSAITVNTGALTITDRIQAGDAQISGTTMAADTEGAIIYATGNFAMGNTATNITFNGTQLTLNGNVVDTDNIDANAVTNTVSAYSATQLLFSTFPPVINTISFDVTITTTGGKVILWATALPKGGIETYGVGGGEGGDTVIVGVAPFISIYRDSTQIVPPTAPSSTFSVSFSENVPAATYTYSIVATYTPTFSPDVDQPPGISHRSLVVTETKR
jgi:hypothetical protein